MQVLLSTNSLEAVGGSETYVITVADHLQRLGYGIWLHAARHGGATAAAEELGVRICRGDADLPEQPDALIVQDAAVAYEMAARYPTAPQVFVAHSDRFDLQLPPQLPGVVAVVVTLYDRVDRRVRALATPPIEVVRLTQPIDVDRFVPTQPPRARPAVALALSGYITGSRLELLRDACAEVGIELRHAGAIAAGGPQPSAVAINDADIVFGKARVIYEAMACGRAAYVFDWNGGDGWVTASNFQALSADNFGGQSGSGVIDRQRLIADLAGYEPSMGTVNRDLVIAHNSAARHAASLAQILRRLTPRAAPVDGPLAELARLVRLYHRADAQTAHFQLEAQRLGAQVRELEERLAHARQAAGEAGNRAASAEASRAQAEVHAEQATARLRELQGTRRWRVAQAALAPADLLRGAVGRRRGR